MQQAEQATGQRDGSLIALTRVCFTPLAAFSAIFGPLLLLFPGATRDYWSWPIRPEMSATWVGAAYTFGSLALLIMLKSGRWVSAVIPVTSTIPFALVMLAATLLHNDLFLRDTAAYYIWLAIYIVLPVALPTMLLLNRRRDAGPTPKELMLSDRLRRGFVAVGVAAACLGFALVVAPKAMATVWPWLLTPLMSRVIGGWLFFLATGGLSAIYEARYAAYRYYLPLAALWFAILLVASIVHLDNFDWGRLATPLYFTTLGGAILLLLAVFAKMESRRATTAHG